MSHVADSFNVNPQIDVVFDCGHFSVTRAFSTVGVLNSTLHLLKMAYGTLNLVPPSTEYNESKQARNSGLGTTPVLILRKQFVGMVGITILKLDISQT